MTIWNPLMGTDTDSINPLRWKQQVNELKQFLKNKQAGLLLRSLRDVFSSNSKINCLVWCQKVEEHSFSDNQPVQVQDIWVGVGEDLSQNDAYSLAREIGSSPEAKTYSALRIEVGEAKVTDVTTQLLHCANPDFGVEDITILSAYNKDLISNLNLLLQEELNDFLVDTFGVGCTVVATRDLVLVSTITTCY